MEKKLRFQWMNGNLHECSSGGKTEIFLSWSLFMSSISIFLKSRCQVSKVCISGISGNMKILGFQKPRSKKMSLRSIIKGIGIIEVLKKKTKFSKGELETLYKIYNKLITATAVKISSLASGDGTGFLHSIYGINRAVFKGLLHNTFNLLVEDLLIERIFSCWDRDSEGTIRLELWIVGLNMFLHGSLFEKMEFCFNVYDLNNDGFITKDEIFQLLKNSLIKQSSEEDSEDGVKDLSEMVLKKLDVDQDGKVSLLDYITTVQEEPLLLEVFGQILPTVESNSAFLLTIKPV